MNKYSVLLLYPDHMRDSGHCYFANRIEATNPNLAVKLAQKEALNRQPN